MNQKLTQADRELILLLVREREQARRTVRELSNKKIAEKFDIHANLVCKVARLYG